MSDHLVIYHERSARLFGSSRIYSSVPLFPYGTEISFLREERKIFGPFVEAQISTVGDFGPADNELAELQIQRFSRGTHQLISCLPDLKHIAISPNEIKIMVTKLKTSIAASRAMISALALLLDQTVEIKELASPR